MIEHLAQGLLILGERWWSGSWIAAASGPVDRWVRRGLRAALTVVVFRIACMSPWLFGGVLLVVVVKALRAATRAAKEPPKQPAKTLAAGRPGLSREAFLGLVWDVLGDAPAVHLATLARHLADATSAPWDGPAVRAACQTHGIPVRPKVRDLGGDRVSSGVHRDDLDPLPQPLPEEADGVVDRGYVAGQDGNATPLPAPHATAATRTVRRVGDLRITAVDDPDNPARTHVTVADPTRKRVPR